MHIRAYVEFQEVTDAPHSRQKPRTNSPHVKGHDGQPGIAFKRVHIQAWRQRALNYIRIPAPVQEEQAGPGLVHHMRTLRTLAEGEAGF